MYHPTPYHWTTDGGLTHIFYTNHMPPSSGFGWSSLCDEVQLPIEGEHFELDCDLTEGDVTCEHCLKRLNGPSITLGAESIVGVNGCLVRIDRNDDKVILRADRICRGNLHHSLPFEPESFSGDLSEQVDNICSECWETYIDHQWRSDDQGGELCIKVWGDEGRSEFFAASAEPIQSGRKGVLRLVSANGLRKDIPHEKIKSIELTPTRQIDY